MKSTNPNYKELFRAACYIITKEQCCSKSQVDNGPEFISRKLDFWCHQNKILLAFIQPGEPTQNAYIERFNGSLRRELLNAYIFKTLEEVKEKTYYWMMDYNQNRPHKALNYKVPIEV